MNAPYDVIVIGGGPGGYTAALYAARAGLKVVVIEKLSAGGQMALTSQIDNYPGFPDGVDGFTLGEHMQQGAERFGAETLLAEVLSVELLDKVKTVHTSEGPVQGKTVIIATGAKARLLGLPNEKPLTGKGVNYCAACDGMFYKGKTVAVIGGGNTAVADALVLSRLCEKVILIHRRDSLRATKVYHQALEKAENVEFLWTSQVTGLLSDSRLTGIRVRNDTTGAEQTLALDGIFVSIGRVPATELFRDQLVLDDSGYICADESTATNIGGVFAAGDVRTKTVRQIVTAVADGAVAAHHAEAYLAQ